jgi:uncharacterized membrane protein
LDKIMRNRMARAVLAALALVAAGGAAHAQLAVCNRTSFVLDAAIGLDDQGAAATQGWFRVDPGTCAPVMAGDPPAGKLLLHARVLKLYAVHDLTPDRGTPMCVLPKNFIHSDATGCTGEGARKVPFVEVKPRRADTGAEVDLADAAGFDLDAAAIAGEQRLLTMAGYDALPIDGKAGATTSAALARFLADHHGVSADKEPPWAALLAAAAKGPGIGLVWCNDTGNKVLAAWGEGAADAKKGRRQITSHGWYAVPPHACVGAVPEPLDARTYYSYGAAVDGDGAPLKRDGKPVVWGGTTMLCTRPASFDIAEQGRCKARGFDATGFAALDIEGHAGITVHFR